MSDWQIRVDSRDADRRIERLGLFLSDLRSFWPIVTRLATGWWRRQFETGGEFGGHPWPALSPSYRVQKEKLYPGKPILVASGQLRRAASSPQRFPTPRSLTLVIDDGGAKHGPVLQFHQEGDGVPKRPLVFADPLPPAAAAELDQAAEAYVRDLLRRLG